MSHTSTSPPLHHPSQSRSNSHPDTQSPPLPAMQNLSLGSTHGQGHGHGQGEEYRYSGIFGPPAVSGPGSVGAGAGAGAWASPSKGTRGFAPSNAGWYDPPGRQGSSPGPAGSAFGGTGQGYGQGGQGYGHGQEYRQPLASHSPPTLSPPSSSTSAPTTASSLAQASQGAYNGGMYGLASHPQPHAARGLSVGDGSGIGIGAFGFDDGAAAETFGLGLGQRGDLYASTPSPPPGSLGGLGSRPSAGQGAYQPFSTYDMYSPEPAASHAFSSRMHAPSPSASATWRHSPSLSQQHAAQSQAQQGYPSAYGSSGYGNASSTPGPGQIPTPSDDVIPTAIVIKNIPFSVPRDSLLSIISSLGAPLPYAFNYHTDSGVFRGLAFANFRAPEEAQSVVAALNGYDVQGRKLRVEYKKVLQPGEKDKIEREKALKRMRSIQFDAVGGNGQAGGGGGGGGGGYGGGYGGFAESRESRAMRDAREMPPPPLPPSIQTSSLSLRPPTHVSGSNGGLSPPVSASSSSGFGPVGAGSGPSAPSAGGSGSAEGDEDSNSTDEPITLDLNDATTLSIYSSVLVFKEDRMRDELAFSRSLSGAERRLVGLVAKKLGLMAVTRSTGPGSGTGEGSGGAGAEWEGGKVVVVVRESRGHSTRHKAGGLNHSTSAYLFQGRGQAFDVSGVGGGGGGGGGGFSAHSGTDRSGSHSRGFGQAEYPSSPGYPYSPIQPSHSQTHTTYPTSSYPSSLHAGRAGAVPGVREPSPAHSHSSNGSANAANGKLPAHLRIKQSMPDLRGFSGPAVARDPTRSLTPQRSSGNLRDWGGGVWGGGGGGAFGGAGGTGGAGGRFGHVFGKDLASSGATSHLNGHSTNASLGYGADHRDPPQLQSQSQSQRYAHAGRSGEFEHGLPEHPEGEDPTVLGMPPPPTSALSPSSNSLQAGVVRNPRGPAGESRGFASSVSTATTTSSSSASTSPNTNTHPHTTHTSVTSPTIINSGQGMGLGSGSISSDTLRADAKDFAAGKALRGSVSMGAGLKGGQ